MTDVPALHVWLTGLDGIDEARADTCRSLLDSQENARADRYAFANDRIQYLVAHALLRRCLSQLHPTVTAAEWRLVEGARRKPDAWANGQRAPVSFNLSHTNGMVGVAAMSASGVPIGFDLEPLNRRVMLAVADRYFRIEERVWLSSLPPAKVDEGFLRLWTLKEAFIKATGEGLARDLASFWFAMDPPRIRFVGRSQEVAAEWHFQQSVIAERFIAAVSIHAPVTIPVIGWQEVALDRHMPSHFVPVVIGSDAMSFKARR